VVRDRSEREAGRLQRPPGWEVAVEIDQLVRGSDRTMLAEGRVVHVYTFRDGLIARMDVEESARD
jgi:hypothetical protein